MKKTAKKYAEFTGPIEKKKRLLTNFEIAASSC